MIDERDRPVIEVTPAMVEAGVMAASQRLPMLSARDAVVLSGSD